MSTLSTFLRYKIPAPIVEEFKRIESLIESQIESAVIHVKAEWEEQWAARQKEWDAEIESLKADNAVLKSALDACEAKLDALHQNEEDRSIPGEEEKPEPLAVAPGHVPWSQRKAQRVAASRSTSFVDKVRKAAAPTMPPMSEMGAEEKTE